MDRTQISWRSVYIILGLWLIVSPWIFGLSDASLLKWNNVLIGIAIFLLGVWEVFGKGEDTLV